jgi:hypothetical protein
LTKILFLILTFLLIHTTTWSQTTIIGIVISKDDKLPMPGVNIVEKGTKNGVISKIDGSFLINVVDENAILVLSYIGMKQQELSLKGQTQVLVKMRYDCIKDYFDTQEIIFYANSGIINNPLGGKIEISSPFILGATLKSSFSYQTNLKENKFINGQIELCHFISPCEYDIDCKLNYKQLSFNNELDSKVYSFQADLNLRKTIFIAGYSNLDFNRIKSNATENASGILLGLGRYISRPLYSKVSGRISLYRNNIEYEGNIQSQYKRFYSFIKYYKLNSFNELSLGIGSFINYRLHRQRR